MEDFVGFDGGVEVGVVDERLDYDVDSGERDRAFFFAEASEGGDGGGDEGG